MDHKFAVIQAQKPAHHDVGSAADLLQLENLVESAAEFQAHEGKEFDLNFAVPFEGQQSLVASELDSEIMDF